MAAVSAGAYVLLASRARAALSRRRMRLIIRGRGGALIGGRMWLAISRSQ